MDILEKVETELRLRGFSEATVKTYLFQIDKFVEFMKIQKGGLSVQKSLVSGEKGDFNFSKVSNREIKAYLSHLISKERKTASSVNLALSSLRFLFIEVLKQNVFEGIKSPKSPKKIPTVLTKDEIRRIMEAVKNPRHKLLIMVMYGSGLRVSEAVSLTFNDLDFQDKTGTIRSGKGKKDRNIILSEALVAELKSYYADRQDDPSPYIFNKGEGHITTRQAQRMLAHYAKKAGIKKRVFCHALRSSFATHLLESGTDIRVIQELLGHSNLSTTERYTKISKEQIRKVKSPFDSV